MSNKTELATLFLELSLYNPEAHDTTSSPPEAQRRQRRAGQSNPRPEAQRQAGPSLYNPEAHDTTSSPLEPSVDNVALASPTLGRKLSVELTIRA